MIALISCNKEKFHTYDSDFQELYNELIDNGHDHEMTWDSEVHSYSFILSEDKVLSAIGYQSHPDLGGVNYLMEITDDTDSSIIFSENYTFSTSEISYATLSAPLTLMEGVPYTINRIQTNWTTYITETIGNVVMTTSSDYPISFGDLTITESNFHDYGLTNSWSKFLALPRIDLVFE